MVFLEHMGWQRVEELLGVVKPQKHRSQLQLGAGGLE